MILSILLLFVIGLFFGSFLGVLVGRIPKKKSFIKGRSQCDNCKHVLGVLDLIPVFSFVFLDGRCRYCKIKLSLFYPIIEISTALSFAAAGYYFLSNPMLLLPLLVILSLLIVTFFIDLKFGIIPDQVTALLIIFSTLFIYLSKGNLLINLACGLLSFLFFLLISIVFSVITKKESLGGADIKFAFFLGLFLGFPDIIVSLYIAFLTGALASIILVVWGRKSFQNGKIAFGPFLALSAFITLLWGDLILSVALKFLGI